MLDLLTAYHWPGNVRELINTLEKAVISDPENPTLYSMHLPAELRIRHTQAAVDRKKEQHATGDRAEAQSDAPVYLPGLLHANPPMREFRAAVIRESECQYLRHLMSVSHNDVKKACAISALSPSRLYTLLRKYNISAKRR